MLIQFADQGEMDMDLDCDEEFRRPKSEYAELMFDRFMKFLLSDEQRIWKTHASCCMHTADDADFQKAAGANSCQTPNPKRRKKTPAHRECLTPVGAKRLNPGDPRLRVASAGTVCVDVSQMGVGSLHYITCCQTLGSKFQAIPDPEAMEGLWGPSSEPLAIWLAERCIVAEDIFARA